jgi:hypothetical protein
MDKTTSRPQHIFVVRLWSECENCSEAQWRGSVEHVPTGKKLYFTSLGDLNDFITLKTAVLSQPFPPKRKANR